MRSGTRSQPAVWRPEGEAGSRGSAHCASAAAAGGPSDGGGRAASAMPGPGCSSRRSNSPPWRRLPAPIPMGTPPPPGHRPGCAPRPSARGGGGGRYRAAPVAPSPTGESGSGHKAEDTADPEAAKSPPEVIPSFQGYCHGTGAALRLRRWRPIGSRVAEGPSCAPAGQSAPRFQKGQGVRGRAGPLGQWGLGLPACNAAGAPLPPAPGHRAQQLALPAPCAPHWGQPALWPPGCSQSMPRTPRMCPVLVRPPSPCCAMMANKNAGTMSKASRSRLLARSKKGMRLIHHAFSAAILAGWLFPSSSCAQRRAGVFRMWR